MGGGSAAVREAERFATLGEYGLLDTAAEPAFDGLTALAAQITAAPIALIALVDRDRRWFTSRLGLSTAEPALEASFCAHVVAADAALEIADAAADPRFTGDRLGLDEPHLRFYAGVPLRTPDGHAIGALCVIDRVPRTLTEPQRQAMALLAAQATTLLGLRREARTAAQLAARAQRQERMLAMGALVAGIGHELNNPLSYLLGNVDLAIEELQALAGPGPSGPLDDVLDALRDAHAGADRIREIVRALRALVHADRAPVPTMVAPVVETAIRVALHELRPRATVVAALAPTAPVLADEARLTQVLVNLLLNAAQAFPTSSPSDNRIVVSSRLIAGRLELAISDNGPGIAPAVLPRIYDPFFTTRRSGPRMGLGLSICHSIVASLDGELACETEVGAGTTFRVRLPLAPTTAPDGEARPRAPRGQVLIVDDDATVLRALGRALQNDHVVVAHGDPRAAWDQLRDGAWFDVVFCDIMMPHLSGPELFRRVRAQAPAQADRFVFISGGVLRDEISAFLQQVPNQRLEKPFSLQNMRGIARRFAATPRPPG